MNFFIYRIRFSSILFGAVTFLFYWGVPLIFSIFTKTLLSGNGIALIGRKLSTHPSLHFFLDIINHQTTANLQLGYLEDSNHLIFSLFLIPGAVMFPMALRCINSTVNRLLSDNIVLDPLHLRETYDRHRMIANHLGWKLFAFFLATTSSLFFIARAVDIQYSYWWGSSAYGVSGFVLACLEFGMVYFGVQAIIHTHPMAEPAATQVIAAEEA